jgi:hypothetical protein
LFVNFTISDIQNNESGSEMVNQEARSVRSASPILAREHVARLNVETAAVDSLDVIDNTNLYHLRAMQDGYGGENSGRWRETRMRGRKSRGRWRRNRRLVGAL